MWGFAKRYRSCPSNFQNRSGATILFVSRNNGADVIAAALRSGAEGYVLKADASSELVPAVEAVLRGERFLSMGARQQLLELTS